MKQEGKWDDHLKRCREFIFKTVDFLKPEKITVLGSGWLLDLPLLELAEKSGKICLIDILHPPDVIKQTSHIKNLELLESDVTGGLIEGIWNKTVGFSLFRKKIEIDQIVIPEYTFTGDPGMIISLNILSQLDSLPVKLLSEKTRITIEEMREFRKRIQEKHISMLQKYQSVLISDFIEVFTDNRGELTEEETVLAVLPGGRTEEEWTWDFDLGGTDFNRKRSVLKVKAILL
jgi:hypothetical protein